MDVELPRCRSGVNYRGVTTMKGIHRRDRGNRCKGVKVRVEDMTRTGAPNAAVEYRDGLRMAYCHNVIILRIACRKASNNSVHKTVTSPPHQHSTPAPQPPPSANHLSPVRSAVLPSDQASTSAPDPYSCLSPHRQTSPYRHTGPRP